MIQHEVIEGLEMERLIRTFSDAGVMIRQIETGRIYSDAIDVPGTGKRSDLPKYYSYEETDQPITKMA